MSPDKIRHLHTAEVLLPMGGHAPVTDAAVVLDHDGVVLEYGHRSSVSIPCQTITHHSVLMPGVVNAHTHLADTVLPEMIPGGDGGLPDWILRLMQVRRGLTTTADDLYRAVSGALQTMYLGGTAAVGEVSNTMGTAHAIADSPVQCRFVWERIAFAASRAGAVADETRKALASADDSPQAGNVHMAIGAHAPYSVSPDLMKALSSISAERGTYLYQHLAEDAGERALYTTGGGRFRDMLEHLNAWDDSFIPPECSPIELYCRVGLVGKDFVAVHLTDATPAEFAMLGSAGSKAVLCPRANLHITGRLPDIEAIVKNQLTFALGTDGPGCVPTLNVFDDARVLFERWPDLKPGMFLRALCDGGSAVLQLPHIGAISTGCRPGLVSVQAARANESLKHLEEEIITSENRHMVL